MHHARFEQGGSHSPEDDGVRCQNHNPHGEMGCVLIGLLSYQLGT